MLQGLFSNSDTPHEGDEYKTIIEGGKTFVIRYGYYEDRERLDPTIDPMPIYPDFTKDPVYTDQGEPFVTMMQDACEYYRHASGSEHDCSTCRHFRRVEDMLGVCECAKLKKRE